MTLHSFGVDYIWSNGFGRIISYLRYTVMLILEFSGDKLNIAIKPGDRLSMGWSGGAMVLRKLPVPGRPTYLGKSEARTYCTCSGCGWRLFGHFFTRLSFLFSFSLSLGDCPINKLKYCLKGPLSLTETGSSKALFKHVFLQI